MSFNFQEYQKMAVRSLKPETTLEMLVLHLVEKVGVIAGIKYKALKLGADSEMIEIWLTEELGWCLWCVAAIAHLGKVDVNLLIPSKKADFADIAQKHCYQKLLLRSYALLSIDSRLTDRKVAVRRVIAIAQNIAEVAQAHNLDISAIASINLAKVAR